MLEEKEKAYELTAKELESVKELANSNSEIAEVEIDFKDGKITIEMVMKEPYEIEDCEEGKAVMVCNLQDGHEVR